MTVIEYVNVPNWLIFVRNFDVSRTEGAHDASCISFESVKM